MRFRRHRWSDELVAWCDAIDEQRREDETKTQPVGLLPRRRGAAPRQPGSHRRARNANEGGSPSDPLRLPLARHDERPQRRRGTPPEAIRCPPELLDAPDESGGDACDERRPLEWVAQKQLTVLVRTVWAVRKARRASVVRQSAGGEWVDRQAPGAQHQP